MLLESQAVYIPSIIECPQKPTVGLGKDTGTSHIPGPCEPQFPYVQNEGLVQEDHTFKTHTRLLNMFHLMDRQGNRGP